MAIDNARPVTPELGAAWPRLLPILNSGHVALLDGYANPIAEQDGPTDPRPSE